MANTSTVDSDSFESARLPKQDQEFILKLITDTVPTEEDAIGNAFKVKILNCLGAFNHLRLIKKRIENMKTMLGIDKLSYEATLTAINGGQFPQDATRLKSSQEYYEKYFSNRTKNTGSHKPNDNPEAFIGGPWAIKIRKICGIESITRKDFDLLKKKLGKISEKTDEEILAAFTACNFSSALPTDSNVTQA